MKELLKEEKAIEDGKEYIADLTDWEREQLQNRKHWWRIEIRVRRDKAHPEISENEMFQSLHLIKPSFSNTKRIQDQALIFFLNSFPEKIEEMNYKAKKRAQELLLNTSDFDLVTVLRLAFAQNMYKLEIELKDYLSSSSLQEYETEQLYTLDEKVSMQHGKELDINKLTFSSNYNFRLHHMKRNNK